MEDFPRLSLLDCEGNDYYARRAKNLIARYKEKICRQITPLTEVQAVRSPRICVRVWISGRPSRARKCSCPLCMLSSDFLKVAWRSSSPGAITDWIGWAMEVTYVAQIAAPLSCFCSSFSISGSLRAKMPFLAEMQKFLSITAKALNDVIDTWLWIVRRCLPPPQ